VTDEHSAGEQSADENSADEHHDPVTHMDRHTVLSDDHHGHGEAALGPIDWTLWSYAILGGVGGVIVLIFFWAALS